MFVHGLYDVSRRYCMGLLKKLKGASEIDVLLKQDCGPEHTLIGEHPRGKPPWEQVSHNNHTTNPTSTQAVPNLLTNLGAVTRPGNTTLRHKQMDILAIDNATSCIGCTRGFALGKMENGTDQKDRFGLSTCIQLVGDWKIPFVAKEIGGSEKAKRRKKTHTKSTEISKKNDVFSREVIPVLSKIQHCIVGVHGNGADLCALDTDTGETRAIEGHAKKVTSLVKMVDDETVVTAGQDGSLCAWEIITAEKGVDLKKSSIGQLREEIVRIVPHPVNKLVLVWVKPNLLKLRHIRDLDMDEVSIEVQDSHIKEISLTTDQIIYATDQGNIYVWTYDQAENPVFNFETSHCDPPMVSAIGSTMVSWTKTEPCISMWNVLSRQKIADLQLKQSPVMVSLFEKSNCLIVVNVNNEMMLYQCRPPKEIRRTTLATFDNNVMDISHVHLSFSFEVLLESGELLQLDIDCESLAEKDNEETNDGKRPRSSTCVIL
ncbi:hypothetical protein CAPTEDRAFT_193199 [Capitella teleta]|uniref:Uncharacterized protein n=1 Tax=Capitella teleta TaxID=283909 RepID=R7UWP2_CAPTE|nr:hypothetical protein CAPTEDRAFT_193199 [Capitella teleta]|eukprot:ELU07826.1 hypothetical protein CAPTEDRAFT_193199 [Capitella teleta]